MRAIKFISPTVLQWRLKQGWPLSGTSRVLVTLLSNLREVIGEWLTLHVRVELGGHGWEWPMKRCKDILWVSRWLGTTRTENCRDLPKLRKHTKHTKTLSTASINSRVTFSVDLTDVFFRACTGDGTSPSKKWHLFRENRPRLVLAHAQNPN